MVEWFQDATQGHTFAAWVVPDERSLEVSWLCGPYSAVFSNGIWGHGFFFCLTVCQNLVYYKLMIERNPNERKRLYEY